ncbi:hypothetical protein ACFVS2_25770 [Brevibacillus sp. NPDC058079]|uniref:hypothetical protein n=1 Tax=Brevibacillus sp. NPDC058079 TaxID=3346330 RepID=UPI0036E09F2F
MNDIHIEFAHIYKDQPFGQEQIKSVSIMMDMVRKLNEEGRSVLTTVLVDDYHLSSEPWSDDYLLEQIGGLGHTPDFIAYEGTFAELANEIIDDLPASVKVVEPFHRDQKEVLFYVSGECKFALKDIYKDREEIKCVTLSCAWMMAKLGLKPFPSNGLKRIRERDIESKQIVSVLPKQYMKVEENVMKLLGVLGYDEEKERIHYNFY